MKPETAACEAIETARRFVDRVTDLIPRDDHAQSGPEA